MIQRILNIFFAALIVAGLTMSPAVSAKSQRYKPFVLASMSRGDVNAKVVEVRAALKNNGFDVVGEYNPYAGTTILVVTNEALKQAAEKNKGGAYAAAQRVSVVKYDGQVQVSYTNPIYMAYGYQMKDNLQGVSDALAKALGREKEFGAKKGLTKRKLRRYHYTFGMEYFDEPLELGKFSSHAAAVKAVAAGLAADKGGVSQIARIDMPNQTLFSIGLQSRTDKYANDKYIMGIIDFANIKSAAGIPYEILVRGDEVYALHMRFRMALNFPDLSMMGQNSFMKIMESPSAIADAMHEVTGR